MFRQTHIRLTFIISIVFIVLISIFGSIIYFYTEHKLYKDVNHSLQELINAPSFMGRDTRIERLAWDKNNNLVFPRVSPQILDNWDRNNNPVLRHVSPLILDNEKKFRPKKFNTFQDVNVENFSFRYIATKVDSNLGELSVVFIRNIDSEKELLDRLIIIIGIGCGLGVICAIVSGYFLAGKALVPIKNAWQKQQEFVSDASHELRTPLAVIQAKTDILFRAPTATIQDKILDISAISNESRRLSKLVANLLTLARSDSDQIEMKKELFRLDMLLKEITQHYEEIILYQEKSILLNADEPVNFFADKERIHQLVVILLDNAMKYTNIGGEIRLSCMQSNSSIILRVEDTGIGIPEADIPKIFDRFYQSDKARTAAEGAGLGLSIAKWIIEKHHGKTKVQSNLGEGTIIEMIFPKAQK